MANFQTAITILALIIAGTATQNTTVHTSSQPTLTCQGIGGPICGGTIGTSPTVEATTLTSPVETSSLAICTGVGGPICDGETRSVPSTATYAQTVTPMVSMQISANSPSSMPSVVTYTNTFTTLVYVLPTLANSPSSMPSVVTYTNTFTTLVYVPPTLANDPSSIETELTATLNSLGLENTIAIATPIGSSPTTSTDTNVLDTTSAGGSKSQTPLLPTSSEGSGIQTSELTGYFSLETITSIWTSVVSPRSADSIGATSTAETTTSTGAAAGGASRANSCPTISGSMIHDKLGIIFPIILVGIITISRIC